MLEELSIRNYALVDSLSLSFESGLNILTGETGAGKSIIVGSLSFLLGGKADADVIRTGCDEAGVSAVVRIAAANADARNWLADRDIDIEDGAVVVRRNLKASGRSSIYVQNVPLTRSDLADLMGMLFDLHGQHDHESLLRKDTHRRCLDRFAGIEGEAAAFNDLFTTLAEKKKALEFSRNSERNREDRIELLSYAADEITKAALKTGESRELEAEAQRLASFEKLSREAESAAAFLFDGEASVLSLARKARSSLEAASSMDESLAAVCKRMDDLYFEAEDLSGELRSYRDGLSYEPGRLEEVEDRLGLIFRLKKKYARSEGSGEGRAADETGREISVEEAILTYKTKAEQEIEALSQSEENREKLAAEIAALEKTLVSKAAALSSKRGEASQKLGAQINAILQRLGMPKARFAVNSASKGKGPSGNLICGPWGADDVEFLISANPGEPLKELARIASGGELSRVMLAIKTVLAESDAIETLVFDEIDTGIGGEEALAVGEYLKKIGFIKQIFCITHLASIAVRADNHIRVEKKDAAGRTQTTARLLSGKGRREEIARMLAGDSAGAAALAHADDLLLKYGEPLKTGCF
ncbi:MAG: DNA repair protein RecN [Spirochaetaceae bacterium]|jgi:DNA repair protein RecN (Recombination protein N)|nr:DNA repair protein RecN [Spirochaetaceae bacterium]